MGEARSPDYLRLQMQNSISVLQDLFDCAVRVFRPMHSQLLLDRVIVNAELLQDRDDIALREIN